MTIHARGSLMRFLVTGFLLVWGQAALAEHYTIPLLVPAGTSGAPQGTTTDSQLQRRVRDRGDLRH